MNFACKHCGMATRFSKTGEAGKDSGLFLFEEAADGVDGVVGILLLQLLPLRSSGRCARTAELRFEQARGDSTDVRDKFWISGRAVNQKRNGGPLAATFASTD